MKILVDHKLSGALKEYDLSDSATSAPVSFSAGFEVRMEKLVRQKQRSYNARVFFQYAVTTFIAVALIVPLFYILLLQRNTENELISMQDTVHVSIIPAARGNIYDRNGVLLVSSRLSDDGNSYIREYHTEHAPHILGYIGDTVAEDGAELAFEEFLRGIDGEQITRISEDGTVSEVEVAGEPVSGQHVYLTIDIDLQKVVEEALSTQIEKINLGRQEDGDDTTGFIPGGAVVVTNVNTGEILSAASYPTFSLKSLDEDREFLQTVPENPMFNRATQGIYSPGSTFQMVTALAGFRSIAILTRDFPIDDTGTFDRYGEVGFVVSCWFYDVFGVGHGLLDIVQALECSCDFYFVQIADWLPGSARIGAYLMAETAQEFGLGIATGIEIPENTGRLATPEIRKEITGESDWYAADTLITGFGQGFNRFTPVQLANYAATIANGGTLYSLSILRSIRSSDHSEILFTQKPEILNVIEEKEYIEIIQEGMLAVSRNRLGTANRVFGNYSIPVASKTGTMQIAGQAENDGAFVCYAPADNPEIAIAIIVEKGGSGSAIMSIARNIFEHYFVRGSTFLVIPYSELIP